MVKATMRITERPVDELRPIKVVCIGAGISGILTAIRFPQRIENLELKLYEKNADIGGTWYENKYPGIACDIPAHAYQFTFASNPNWSRLYAPGGEIQEYLKDVAHRYDVEKYITFKTEFESAEWKEDRQKWEIRLRNLTTKEIFVDSADVLLKATGILNKWSWPDIPGLKSFKGQLLHSANFDTSFEPKDKRIALIGGGSSGIQILPKIQPIANHVSHFMKGKTWISPIGYGAEAEQAAGGVIEHSAEQRAGFQDPKEYRRYRHLIEGGLNASQLVTFRGTDIQKLFWEMADASMKEKLLKKPEIYKALVPEYPPGCRRLTPGPGYLEALVEDNVDFVSCGIREVTETGLYDNEGKFHEVDAIICATGFDTSLKQDHTPITGLGGITLDKVWEPTPEAYLSLCTTQMPNLFFYLGPNGGPGAGSAVHTLERVAEYIIKCVKKLQREYIASMVVSQRANSDFSRHIDEYFAKTIFTYTCKSWFKRNIADGRVVALWPGSSVHAEKTLAEPRFEDFEYVRLPQVQDNSFNWLGNGLTVAQAKNLKTTDYLDEVDIPPIINTGPRNTGVKALEEVRNGTDIVTNGISAITA